MKTALEKLIDRLDAVGSVHEEVHDTEVREQMADAINAAFVERRPDYELPKSFGMFSAEGDALIYATLNEFLTQTISILESNPVKRLALFQDASVVSDEGNIYDEYFGHVDGGAEQSGMPVIKTKPWWKFW